MLKSVAYPRFDVLRSFFHGQTKGLKRRNLTVHGPVKRCRLKKDSAPTAKNQPINKRRKPQSSISSAGSSKPVQKLRLRPQQHRLE